MAPAFGAPSLGTALVVNFDSAAIIWKRIPRRPLSRMSVESANDYQSGTKRRRPKGSADLICKFRACQIRLSFQNDATSNVSVRLCRRRIIEPLPEVARGKLVINLRAELDRRQGRAGELFFNDGRGACGQCARRDHRTRSDHAARRDHGLLANHRRVQHDRAHPDDRAVFDRAAFEQRAVADGHVIFENRGNFGRGVNDRVVLNVRSAPDDYPALVAAQHDAIPYARAIADLDVADDHRGRGYKNILADARVFTFIFDNHLSFSPIRFTWTPSASGSPRF